MAAEPLSFDAPFLVGAQIDARAAHPVAANKVLLMHDDRHWTYRQFRDECVRMAHFLLRRLGPIDDSRPGHVAMLLENHLELLALYGGCAYGGLTLFGVNTGLRGEVLAGVLNQSRARVLVVDERFLPEVERVRERAHARRPGEHPGPAHAAGSGRRRRAGGDLLACLDARGRALPASRSTPRRST